MSDTPLLYDWNGVPVPAAAYAPLTNRPNQALYTPQGGMLALGSDYGSTPKAQVPKCDGTGSLYVVPSNPAGNPAQVYTTQAAAAATSQYGNPLMLRQDLPAPSNWQAATADPNGCVQVHHKSKVTFRTIATSVTCAANKSLMSMVNSSSMIMRINECVIYVPPAGGAGSGLLGASGNTTYYALICELRRISSHTAGASTTTLNPVSGDTADSLSSGVVVYSNATVGTSLSTFHRQDAVVTTNTGLPWYGRGDHNEKTFVVRPGEGFSVTCISSGTVNNSAGTGTTTASVDVELTFTQCAA